MRIGTMSKAKSRWRISFASEKMSRVSSGDTVPGYSSAGFQPVSVMLQFWKKLNIDNTKIASRQYLKKVIAVR